MIDSRSKRSSQGRHRADLAMKHFGVQRIISGGQTGADRGGLDAALRLNIPHGGYCPLGRKAEDGRIPDVYDLQEMDTDDYCIRTRRNVAFAHATVVFYYDVLDGGSLLTVKFCHELRTQCHVVDLKATRPMGSSRSSSRQSQKRSTSPATVRVDRRAFRSESETSSWRH